MLTNNVVTGSFENWAQISLLGYYASSAHPVQTPQNAMSDQGQHCLFTAISMQNKKNREHPPGTPKIRNGLTQMIKVDKSFSKMGEGFIVYLAKGSQASYLVPAHFLF